MTKQTTANLSFEKKLWAAADKMRNNMDPAEYKHVVLGLIFLKYISDSLLTNHPPHLCRNSHSSTTLNLTLAP